MVQVWYGISQALSRAEDTKIGSLEADRSDLSEQVRSVSVAKVHQLCGLILLQFRVVLLFSFRFGTVNHSHSHPHPHLCHPSDHFTLGVTKPMSRSTRGGEGHSMAFS